MSYRLSIRSFRADTHVYLFQEYLSHEMNNVKKRMVIQ
jgi:hypothetical protein